MTVYVFKLTTGEDIIGVVENSLYTKDEYYNIIDPMYIEPLSSTRAVRCT